MAISNELLSTTLHKIRDEAVDGLYKKTAFLDGAKNHGGIETEDGGTKLVRPLQVDEHSQTTEIINGWEPINYAIKDTMAPAEYDWAMLVKPVLISERDEKINRGEAAVIKLLDVRFQNVLSSLRREINKQILAAGSPTTKLNTLYGAGSATGFLESAAPGLQTNVVGGLSKATYSSQSGWQNQFADIGDAFSTNGLESMYKIWNELAAVSPRGAPQLIIASPDAFTNYKRALQANERYVDQKVLDGGRMSLMFNGAAVELDPEMPTSSVADEEISFYFLNFELLKLVMMDGCEFAVGDFEPVSGQAGRAARITWMGQLVADHLGSQGVVVDGNSW